ncbi:hypothetical protein [Xanthomonas cannabis]|uniref:Transposase n=1 Tax=Xanthomonas cannabis TaxID=1885674 RepID=A0ABR6JKW4_9XANT|nr:hypothetical protein [Xanthomonas cannabis]MBB4593455.1 hypothetical protein [Xanthomonas cannabis]MBB5523110.1 hypothetical protein [Xanthomonas cannabis]
MPIGKQDMRPLVQKHHVTIDLLGICALHSRYRRICGIADREDEVVSAKVWRRQNEK